MSTSDLTLTLVGWVGTEPKHYTGPAVTPFTSFRMANTRRWFDRAQDAWTDGRTEWFTVKVWRQSALNVAASLRKGDPVLVHGRLSTEQWDSPEGPRTSLVLEALAIGPDLTYGRASFARTVHVGGGASAVTGAPEESADASDGAEEASAVEHVADDPWATDLTDLTDLEGDAAAAVTASGAPDPAGDDAAEGAGARRTRVTAG